MAAIRGHLASPSKGNKDASLQTSVRYVREKNIARLLNDMIIHILEKRPDEPVKSLVAFLKTRPLRSPYRPTALQKARGYEPRKVIGHTPEEVLEHLFEHDDAYSGMINQVKILANASHRFDECLVMHQQVEGLKQEVLKNQKLIRLLHQKKVLAPDMASVDFLENRYFQLVSNITKQHRLFNAALNSVKINSGMNGVYPKEWAFVPLAIRQAIESNDEMDKVLQTMESLQIRFHQKMHGKFVGDSLLEHMSRGSEVLSIITNDMRSTGERIAQYFDPNVLIPKRAHESDISYILGQLQRHNDEWQDRITQALQSSPQDITIMHQLHRASRVNGDVAHAIKQIGAVQAQLDAGVKSQTPARALKQLAEVNAQIWIKLAEIKKNMLDETAKGFTHVTNQQMLEFVSNHKEFTEKMAAISASVPDDDPTKMQILAQQGELVTLVKTAMTRGIRVQEAAGGH